MWQLNSAEVGSVDVWVGRFTWGWRYFSTHFCYFSTQFYFSTQARPIWDSANIASHGMVVMVWKNDTCFHNHRRNGLEFVICDRKRPSVKTGAGSKKIG